MCQAGATCNHCEVFTAHTNLVGLNSPWTSPWRTKPGLRGSEERSEAGVKEIQMDSSPDSHKLAAFHIVLATLADWHKSSLWSVREGSFFCSERLYCYIDTVLLKGWLVLRTMRLETGHQSPFSLPMWALLTGRGSLCWVLTACFAFSVLTYTNSEQRNITLLASTTNGDDFDRQVLILK